VRAEGIAAWCRGLEQRAAPLIDSELGSTAWNVQMRLEADRCIGMVDRYVFEHADEISAKFPASTFDMDAVFEGMPDEPGPPEGDTGVTRIPLLDLQGRVIEDGKPQYTVLAHLTQKQVKPKWVKLAGPPTGHVLESVRHFNGVPHMLNFAGGSKLKPDGITLDSIFKVDPDLPRDAKQPRPQGKLIAIPLGDTVPGSDLSKAMPQWMGPNQESYWYFQRFMLASPPDIPGLGPTDHVLQVKGPVKEYSKRAAGQPHPLVLHDAQGRRINWVLDDGAMVIPRSLAEKCPALAGVLGAAPGGLKPYGEERGVATVPASALQRYGRSDAVVRESDLMLRQDLDQEDAAGGEGDEAGRDGERQFRRLTCGGIKGVAAMAGHSSNDTLYLSSVKSSRIRDVGAGVMVARSPYEQANIRTFGADKVCTDPADPTVKFLDEMVSFQYTTISRERMPPDDAGKPQWRFRAEKGKAYVVPDEYLPEDHRQYRRITCDENIKNRPREGDAVYHCEELMVVTDVFAPGSEYLIPVAEQEASSGDVDGDPGVIVGDRPMLFAHIDASERERRANPQPTLKQPKSRTPAVDDQGRYRFGRSAWMLDALESVLAQYAKLQMRYFSFAPDVRRDVAERAVFGLYEGMEPQLKRDVRAALQDDDLTEAQVATLIERARQDATHAAQPFAQAMAQWLVDGLTRLRREIGGAPAGDESDALPDRASEMFPQLVEAVEQAEDTRGRIEAMLNCYPQRLTTVPGAVPGDACRSLENFLELGYRAGLDGFKSDTQVRLFKRFEGRLQKLFNEKVPGSAEVDYGKSTARKINAGVYDHESAKERLASDPTLEAQIMEVSGDTLIERGRLPLPPRPRDAGERTAGQPAPRPEDLHREARDREPAISAHVRQVLASGGTERDVALRIRSVPSMQGQLAGATDSARGASKAPTALRYVLEYPPAEYTRRCRQAMLDFNGLGYATVKIDNAFTRHDPLFLGISLTLEAPDGYRFSVQFHTPASYRVKHEQHDAHKQVQQEHRKSRPDKSRVSRLQEGMRQACMQVPAPPGVEEISSWYEDPSEGVAYLRQGRAARPQGAAVPTPAKALAQRARTNETRITPFITTAASAAGALLKGNARWEGGRVVEAVANRYLKSVESLKTKIRRDKVRSGQTASEAAAAVKDALRYSMVWSSPGFSEGVRRAQASLRAQGMRVTRWNNHFTNGNTTYKGINLTVADAEGYEFELQFHTSQSFEAKVKNHLSYKKADRAQGRLDAGPPASKIDALEAEVLQENRRMQAVAGEVPQPPGVALLAAADTV
jgi:hypothetical protein